MKMRALHCLSGNFLLLALQKYLLSVSPRKSQCLQRLSAARNRQSIGRQDADKLARQSSQVEPASRTPMNKDDSRDAQNSLAGHTAYFVQHDQVVARPSLQCTAQQVVLLRFHRLVDQVGRCYESRPLLLASRQAQTTCFLVASTEKAGACPVATLTIVVKRGA